jgi:hypothetical protein
MYTHFLQYIHMNVAQPIETRLLARIKAHKNRWVFTPSDFLDLGSRGAVDIALFRLTKAGTIRRIAQGLYDVPRHHPIVGEAPPDIDSVVKALAGKNAARLQPTGAYAANLLGLSDQVPAKVVFLTNGRSKHLRLGRLDIALKQTSPRIMATAGRISGLVIQALRYLGRAHVGDETLRRLNRRLSANDRKQLLKDVDYAPAWIADIMRRLGSPS